MSDESQNAPTPTESVHQDPAAATIYCEMCGVKNLENNFRCTSCRHILHETPRPVISTGDEDSAMRLILPVGRSGLAIASGYLGLISILILPAPAALVTGILAIRDIQRHPEKHGMGRAIFGIVMGMFGSALFIFGVFALVMEQLEKPN